MNDLLPISVAVLLGLSGAAVAAPLRVLAIGDSMTEEYAFELTFSAPESDELNANVRNWPELWRIFRPTEASLGPYEATGGAYFDLRNAGHEWNFGIPGTNTRNWVNLLSGNAGSDPLGPLYSITQDELEDQIWLAQVVVILVGSNDLKQDYNDLFNDTEPADYFTKLLNRLNFIYAWVNNSRGPNARPPIVVCTLPDVGATPQISDTYNIPEQQASTRAKIAAFNQSILTWAAGKAINPPVIARIDLLTDRLFDEQPFHLNGTVFNVAGHRDNPPTHIFCRDGFHIGTMAQALVANEIMAAINARLGTSLTPFPNREILQSLLGLNPDQPYLTWAAAEGLPGSEMDGNPDGDDFPNLVEFLLASDPDRFDRPVTGSFSPGQSLSWLPDAEALRFATLTAEESTDLMTWSPVPPERTQTAGDGTVSVTPAAGSKSFVRLKAAPRP